MTAAPPRIAFLVTHLMGSGHVVRTLRIARALTAAGARALVISGGRALAHLGDQGALLAQLPPLSIRDLDYKTLRMPNGAPADGAYMAARAAAIAQEIAAFAPDVLVTELYPFGRRALGAEFEGAVAARPAGCRLVASIRDVLEPPSKPKRAAQTLERLAPYDLVLCHGDPRIAPLAISWPGGGAGLPAGLAARLAYTGYVADLGAEAGEEAAVAAPVGAPSGEILVSVGSGAVGRALLEMAARASALSPRPWRLLVGGADAAETAARLRALGPAMAEPPRADYTALLRGAALSISLAGYNTAVEAARRSGPSLLIAMEEGGEREQILRAAAFGGLAGVTSLRIGDLGPARLAAAAETAIAAGAPARAPLAANGAPDSARRLIALARGVQG